MNGNTVKSANITTLKNVIVKTRRQNDNRNVLWSINDNDRV